MNKPIIENLQKSPSKILLLDYLRIFACLGVFSCHLWAGLLHYLANFLEGLKQINNAMPECLGIHGDALYKCGIQPFFLLPNDKIANIIFNVSNIISGLGYQGVHLFFFLSGFGLTFSAFRTVQKSGNNSIKWLDFLKKRLIRLYPYYWIILTLFMVLNYSLYRTLLGFIKTYVQGFIFLNIIPATWFIPIIIQLYIIFPILFYLLRHSSTQKFLIESFLIKVVSSSIIIIGSVLIFGKVAGFGYGALAPGGIALTRLFEFSLGMALAKTFVTNHYSMSIFNKFRQKNIIIAGFMGEFLGLFLSSKYTVLTIGNHAIPLGLIVSDVFVGTSIVCLSINFIFLLIPLLQFLQFNNSSPIGSISNGTYQAYLFHGVFLGYFTTLFTLPLFRLSQSTFEIGSLLFIIFVYSLILIAFSLLNLSLGFYLEKCKIYGRQRA